jgi:hypothetical protein
MSGAFFYIEYTDGSVTETEFKTTQMARKAYKLYEKEPEDNAKGWGWDTKYEVPTLTQQIRENKMTKELV